MSTNGIDNDGEMELLEDGKVKVKDGKGPFTLPHGVWKTLKDDKLHVEFKDRVTKQIVIYIMIRTEFGWKKEGSTEMISEPVRKHVTKAESKIMGEWDW